ISVFFILLSIARRREGKETLGEQKIHSSMRFHQLSLLSLAVNAEAREDGRSWHRIEPMCISTHLHSVLRPLISVVHHLIPFCVRHGTRRLTVLVYGIVLVVACSTVHILSHRKCEDRKKKNEEFHLRRL
ncbi:hypothetical protein PMAYCL1PPCAC_21118, partial [Pristionchus mayeri]